MRQPHAEHPGAVLPDAATNDHTLKADPSPMACLEREQSWPVRPSIVAAQVPNLRAVDPHRDGVRVVGLSGSVTSTAWASTRRRSVVRPPATRHSASW